MQNTPAKQPTVWSRLLGWLEDKEMEGAARRKLLREFRENRQLPKQDRLWSQASDEVTLFVMVNLAVGTLFWVRKKTDRGLKIAVATAIFSLFYAGANSVGEAATFQQNLLRDDHVGYYLRKRYLAQLHRQPTRSYRRLNERFERVYIQPSVQP